MIDSSQFVNCIWMATVLIVLGLLPGCFRSAMNVLSRFAAPVQLFRFAPLDATTLPSADLAPPRWLAAVGIVTFLLGLFAYMAR